MPQSEVGSLLMDPEMCESRSPVRGGFFFIEFSHFSCKRPAIRAFRIGLAHEIVCPLTGELRGTDDERYGAFWA
jgi:hypothetical protein